MNKTISHPVLMACLVLLSVVFGLYSVSLGHNFLFDEESIILNNPLVRNLALWPELFKTGFFYHSEYSSIVWNQYYRPLTSLSFALDYRFWKLDPLGYNLTNTTGHILVCLLLFFFLKKLIRRTLPAFLAALLFGVHPIQTEAVTYIASRGDLLGTGLMLATLYLYWDRKQGVALITASMALLAKESSVLIPVYLYLLEACILRETRRTVVRRLTPFVLLSGAYGFFRVWLCPVPGPGLDPISQIGLRVCSMAVPLFHYAGAIFMPAPFKFCETIVVAPQWGSPVVWVTLGVFLLLAAGLVLGWRFGSDSVRFGLGMTATAFLPCLPLVHLQPEWAEHYLYFGMIGLSVLAASGIRWIIGCGGSPVKVFRIIYTAFFIFLCARTVQRNQVYQDPLRYYQTLAQSDSPYAIFGYWNSIGILLNTSRDTEAFVALQKAEALDPQSEVVSNSFGIYYLRARDYPKALEYFERAYRRNPRDLKAGINVALTLVKMKRFAEAIALYEEIQKLVPKYTRVYIDLAGVYELSGRPETGLQWLDEGLKNVVNDFQEIASLRLQKIKLLYRLGDRQAMMKAVDRFLAGCPDLPWYTDVALLLKGRISPGHFMDMVPARYPGLEADAGRLALMACVISGRRDLAVEILQKNEARMRKDYEQDALFQKELMMVRQN